MTAFFGDMGDRPEWRRRSACSRTLRLQLLGLVADIPFDTDLWFPVRQGDPSFAAKRVCAACPVRGDCLADALDRGEEFGIWGGAGESVRRSLRNLDPDVRAKAVGRHFVRLDYLASTGVQPAGATESYGLGSRCGTAAKYGRGCRCLDCRAAKREADRQAKVRAADRRSAAS